MSLPDWTLFEVASAISTRQVSCEEVVRDRLAAIEAWQPRINAFARTEPEAAIADARQADAEFGARGARGPLHGVPLAHKDMLHRPGRRPSMGSRAAPPPTGEISTVLERLDAAGALEIGALNMAEFALGPTGHNAFLGDCRNPWNPAHVSGGSSSGGGAAVAARLVYGSVGSDTGGSVRLPASATGVVGLKPTNGRLSLAGMMPLAPSVDVPGLFGRTARDVALLLGLVAGHDPRDARSSRRPVPDYLAEIGRDIRGLRIGIPENFFLDAVDGEVAEAVSASLRVLESLGGVAVPVRVPHPEPLTEMSRVLVYAEASAVHGEWLRQHWQGYAPQVRVRAATGIAIPAPVYLQAQQLRPRLLERFVREVYARCDVLHLPTLGLPVPTRAETDVGSAAAMWDKIARMVRCTAPLNYLGLPAIAVPCGHTGGGLPTSFQLVGRPFAEGLLLRVADRYQDATDWHRRAPALPDAGS